MWRGRWLGIRKQVGKGLAGRGSCHLDLEAPRRERQAVPGHLCTQGRGAFSLAASGLCCWCRWMVQGWGREGRHCSQCQRGALPSRSGAARRQHKCSRRREVSIRLPLICLSMVPKGGCHFPDSLLCSQGPEGLSSWPQVDSVLPQCDASHLSLFLCMLGASSVASLGLILSISPALLLTCPWILELLTPQINPHIVCLLLSSLPQAIPGWAHRFILSLPLYACYSFVNTSIFIRQFSCLSEVLSSNAGHKAGQGL